MRQAMPLTPFRYSANGKEYYGDYNAAKTGADDERNGRAD